MSGKGAVDADAWGISTRYQDAAGNWQDVPPESADTLAATMGTGGEAGPPPDARVRFVRTGRSHPLDHPADVQLEDGTVLSGATRLPPDLPAGYHALHPLDGSAPTRLVASQGRCHLPADLHAWGWAVQLYAARSASSWGLGDLGDLASLARRAGAQGAGVVALNPLHAVGPAPPQQPSPYSPSSRRYRNPLYLRVEDVPGAADLGDELGRLAAAGRALNDDRHIDRDAVWRLKAPALEACFQHSSRHSGFEAFLRTGGEALRVHARFCALAERHGNNWRRWPAGLRRPDGSGVAPACEADSDRVRFHAWLQWQLDVQLGRVGGVALLHDLAIGFDPGGSDAWAWQDNLALDVTVGAPPDQFNPAGQDWGLPPFVPWKLRAAGYEPLVHTLRAAFRHAGGLRIDHVMGLFRLFWIPPGTGPAEGAYVRYPASEMLDILAVESQRAGAFAVGEDLGTVEPGVRAELARRRVLSYRLLWFQGGRPARWPAQALAAATTHDLPTIPGLWSDADLRLQSEAGVEPNRAGHERMRARLRRLTGLSDGAPAADVVAAAYRALAGAPSRVVLATLEDALGVEERPNLPGTVGQRPNWSLALPVPLDEALSGPGVDAVARALSARR